MNKFRYLLAGSIAGGILGYLIADFIAYKMDEAGYAAAYKKYPEREGEEPVGGMDTELYNFKDDGTIGTDYAKRVTPEDKATLEELTRPYQDEKEPFIIPFNEWDDSISSFVQKTILYYEHDNIFCDDQEVPIEDPVNMFGPNVHLHFGEDSDDPDAVYVSNPGRSEMYEILKMKASYKADVLGEVDADSPKEDSPKKRVNQPGSSQERAKKEAENLGDVDDTDSNA